MTISDVSNGKTTMILGNLTGAATGTNTIGVLDTTGGLLTGTFGTVTLGLPMRATPTSGSGGAVGSMGARDGK